MTHVEFTILMSEVLDHEALPADVQRLHEHLGSCPACTLTWVRWQSVDSLLASAPVLAPPAGFVQGVNERLAQRRRQSKRRRWLGSGLLLAWGALIAVVWLVILGSLLWGFTHPAGTAGLLAWCSEFGSGMASIARGLLQGAFQALSGWQLWAGLASYLGVTALVAAGWFWLMAHKSGWADVLSTARDASV